MKDTKNSPFIHDVSNSLHITGSTTPAASSYVRFNHFRDSNTEVGTYISDFATESTNYVVSAGERNGNTGDFWPVTGSLTQLDVYGQKVYTDEFLNPNVGARTIMSQRGLALPLSSDPVFVSRDMSDLYSTDSGSALTFMFKVQMTAQDNDNLSIAILADATGDPVPDAFSLSINNLEIFSSVTGDGTSQTSSPVDISRYEFVTVFAALSVDGAGEAINESFAVYETATGVEVLFQELGNSAGVATDLVNPTLYVGYGDSAHIGSVNNAFLQEDFVRINLAEIAIFDSVLTQDQMQTIARSHLSENQYKSGFNNRAPRRVQQLFDSRTVYPSSANPASTPTQTAAFNDQLTKLYGIQPVSGSVSGIMYPEMLPAHMFSGSDDSRGAEGDVKPFYRDLHQTEYEKRLVAPGAMRQGLSHKETEILNVGTRNSPVVIGEDSDALGGTIEPFNDNNPLADKNEQPAVNENVIPGLNQRLGDHVAIVIDLNPADDTTIGVERTGGAKSWLGETTGRVTSMAYFNFATKKWETAGKNNDFVIPGAMTVSTGSSANLTDKLATVYRDGFRELVESSSVGFAGTSGFTILEDQQENALAPLANRGVPISTYGFPLHSKYEAKDDQLIDMSDYIDSPFLLEKVEFEVDIAVEDSGPHALGYKMSSVPGEADEVWDDIGKPSKTSFQPTIRFYPDIDSNPDNGSQFYLRTDYDTCLNASRVSLSRGTFLNGSWCIDTNDFSIHRHVTNIGESWAGDYSSYRDTSSSALASILLGYQNHNRIDIPTHDSGLGTSLRVLPWANPGFRFSEGSGTLWSRTQYYGYSGDPNKEQHPARVMLPVVPGPRTGASSSPTRQKWNDNASLWATRQPDVADPPEDWTKKDVTVSYVPVLAAGVNGIVTGSTTAGSDPHAKPVAYVEKRGYDLAGSDWDDISDSQQQFWGTQREPGVPFWRADTFFLLRQSKTSEDRRLEYTFSISGDSSKVFYPISPYVDGLDQPQRIYGDEYQTAAGDRTWDASVEMSSMHGPLNKRFGRKRYGREGVPPTNYNGDLDSDDLVESSGFSSQNDPKLTWTNSGSTNRELITFGQVVHYGYCAAQDGYVDTVMDDIDVTAYPNNSGSIDSTYETAIRGVQLPLFGQAIKLSRKHTSVNSVIPSSPGYTEMTSEMSAFSDAPDSFQGTWSFEVGERSQQENYFDRTGVSTKNWFPSFTYLEGRPETRYTTLTYDGSTAGDRTLAFPRYLPSARSGFSHTLDNWQSTALVNEGIKFEYSGSVWPLDNDLTVTQQQQAGPGNAEFLIPGGSGFSMISTPAWPVTPGLLAVEEGRAKASAHDTGTNRETFIFGSQVAQDFEEYNEDNGYRRYRDYAFFGGFEFSAAPRVASQDPLGEPPTKSWLDAGLRREKNILIGTGHQHEGENIDFSDSWAGFTLMTASTVFRPLEAPGRETATLPLHANVYKRQWLNFQRGVSFSVPVKSISPTTAHDPGYWVVTAPDILGPQLAPRNTSSGSPPEIFTPDQVTDTFTGDPAGEGTATFSFYGKRYHRRYTMSPNEGGYEVGPLADGFNSGRVFFRPAIASKRIGSKFQRTQSPSILHGWGYRGDDGGIGQGTEGQELLADQRNIQLLDSPMTGSVAEDIYKESLYVLKPSDKLILGIQPSLPGWNPGSGLPNNRWVNKWGPWDYERSSTAGIATALDRTSGGVIIDDPKMNLEDPYEPCHGLTMLQGKSRVILYGTFLRDNKHYSPSSKQQLRSAAVHEALHFDNPVLDQFLTDNAYEYAGSNLTQHITGSMLDGNRGVAGTLSAGSLTFSGSFQRFTRATEDSQVFYDTLLQDPYGICSNDGLANKSTGADPNAENVLSKTTFVYMHASNSGIMQDASVQEVLEDCQGYAVSHSWPDSFPFEAKYANVSRLLNRDGAGIISKNNNLWHSLRPPAMKMWEFSGYTTRGCGATGDQIMNDFITLAKGPLFASGSSGDVLFDQPYDPNTIQRVDLGWQVTGITNMANTHTNELLLGGEWYYSVTSPSSTGQSTGWLDSIYTVFSGSEYSAATRAEKTNMYRTFAAAMVGYGRQNRKQLDFFDKIQGLAYIDFNGLQQSIYGSSLRSHPAGFKYGYMNCDHLSPSTVHRADHYGQFRDMLEQRLYGKVYSFGDEYNKRGESESAVTCIFVDADGAPIDDATKTQCLNLSTAMTSSKPFIEGEVLRELIFSSESVVIE